MWDDSYDSMSSPEPPKGKVGSRASALSGKSSSLHDLNSGLASKNSKKFQKNDQRDIDSLFSPSNSGPNSEANSPDGRPVEKRQYVNPYSFEEPKNDNNANYLANFATNSGDLEDSILGELLGVPKKSVPKPSESGPTKIERGGRKLSPAAKLEPIEVKSPKATNSPNMPPRNSSATGAKEFPKHSISRFSNDGPLSSIRSVDFGNDHRPETTSAAAMGSVRPHFNSFDVSEGSSRDDNDQLEGSPDGQLHIQPSKPSGVLPTKVDSSLTNKRTTHIKPEFNPGIASTISGDSLPNSVTQEHEKKESADEETTTAASGFIPSFLDPNKQGAARRRRGGGGDTSETSRPMTTGSLKKMDELDAALGFSSNAGPSTGINKKPVDPFAMAEKKISSLPISSATTGNKPILGDSDSSSDEDLLKPKSRSYTTPKFGVKTSIELKKEAEKPSPVTLAPSSTSNPAGSSSIFKEKEPQQQQQSQWGQSSLNNIPAVATTADIQPKTAAATTSTQPSSLGNLPTVGKETTSSVVKLPSPEHKFNQFTFNKQQPLPEKDEDSDLDISGILKANDDELTLFGLKNNNSNSITANKDKDEKRKMTTNSPAVTTQGMTIRRNSGNNSNINTSSGSRDENEERFEGKKVEQQQQQQPASGIQLARKSVGNIRSPTSKNAENAVKSPTAASSSSSVAFQFKEEEKTPTETTVPVSGRYPRDAPRENSTASNITSSFSSVNQQNYGSNINRPADLPLSPSSKVNYLFIFKLLL
jgi:hypothetical protein